MDKHIINTEDRKLEVLKVVYAQLHSMKNDDEAVERKTSTAIVTIFLFFVAYLVKGDIALDEREKTIVIVFIILITAVSLWFLHKNSLKIRGNCRTLVRVEEAMGLYEENLFYREGNELKTLFPVILKKWGKDDTWLSLTPHVCVVCMAGILASISVMFIG